VAVGVAGIGVLLGCGVVVGGSLVGELLDVGKGGSGEGVISSVVVG
jgi:hypothetical protein